MCRWKGKIKSLFREKVPFFFPHMSSSLGGSSNLRIQFVFLFDLHVYSKQAKTCRWLVIIHTYPNTEVEPKWAYSLRYLRVLWFPCDERSKEDQRRKWSQTIWRLRLTWPRTKWKYPEKYIYIFFFSWRILSSAKCHCLAGKCFICKVYHQPL